MRKDGGCITACTALAASLKKAGAHLTLRRGAAAQVIPLLVSETGATAIYWNRYELFAIARDAGAKIGAERRRR